ncbi:SoxR reducing system RseC family protein [Alteromonas sp. a30]|uniref:SoxR reducing system RseC family protein n=1 Tax=Alteromonas sp. a30 TaxID=2730917 RepID=UPI002280874F|nr:SoxR reducing system RseC family protein [Alteromonas sp. a30]MCY7296607.1 SoxR reducing system RseC family protein [Alteromonas sp. a30]
MIEEIGTVKQVDSEHIVVQTQLKNACQACSQKSQCGTGVIARAVAKKHSDIAFSAEEQTHLYQAGEQVRLGVNEESLLAASAIMYVFPLMALILGALLGQLVLPVLGLSGEGFIIALAFLSMLGAFKIVKKWTRRQCAGRFQPILLGKFKEKEEASTLPHT